MIPGSGRSPGEGKGYPLQYSWASLVAQMVKNAHDLLTFLSPPPPTFFLVLCSHFRKAVDVIKPTGCLPEHHRGCLGCGSPH